VLAQLPGIAVAILGGAAVGVERQRSGHAVGPDARLGGIRTFTLLGTLAGVAGALLAADRSVVAAVLVTGAIALVLAAYVRASRNDVDATTEVAALVVIAAGVLGGLGELYLAAGLTTFTVLLLAEKPRLHALVERVDETTLLAATRFAVMSVVVLPLLPEGPFGPGPGIRPREIWLLVLLFSGLSFVGFIGRRLAGAAGYPLAGVLGGLVSSTSVTLTFARLSRVHATQASALAAGAVAACTVLFVRVAVAVAALNPALLQELTWYLVPPFLGGLASLVLAWRTVRPAEDPPQLKNPLQFRAALEMAVLFQIVLLVVPAAQSFIGATGVLVSGFVLGLTDVDALTLAMSRGAVSGIPAALAAQAIALGIFSNTLLKLGVAALVGDRRFALYAGLPLAAMAAITGVLVAL
jgi:uncharacterized membrane protein (DUF4010 family)